MSPGCGPVEWRGPAAASASAVWLLRISAWEAMSAMVTRAPIRSPPLAVAAISRKLESGTLSSATSVVGFVVPFRISDNRSVPPAIMAAPLGSAARMAQASFSVAGWRRRNGIAIYSEPDFRFCRAIKILSGVTGNSTKRTPMASYKAFTIAGATPTDGTSPNAFAPIGPMGSTTLA